MKEGNELKRNFFRKNIFTISGVIIFILVLFVIINPFNSKQGSSKKTSNKLKQENKQLKQENVDLKSEKSFYMDKSNKLQQDLDKSNTASGDIIIENQKKFERLQTVIKNELVDSLSIFSPEYTKKGDKIAGLTVSEVISEPRNGSTSYHVNFTGEFVVKGTLILNDSDGNYIFRVKDDLEKLPHSLQEFEGIVFFISNKDELIKTFGDKSTIDITGIFKNFSYNYVPETDWGHGAEFVRLISQK
jgi:hypothetical protein